jgi:hypothetical protein
MLRFTATNASSSTVITRKNLLCAYLMGYGSSTTLLRLIAGIKLNRIEIYGSVASAGFANTVSVEWLSNYGPSSEISDTSTSTSEPAHLVTSPPPQSLASFWSMIGTNESENIFNISCTAGSIIDVWVDIVLLDGQGNTASTSTTASGTYLYVTYLDGPASAYNGGSGLFPATAVVTIN